MSKILVIPDIHSRKFWRKAILDNLHDVDKIIFLGDYLDPYPDEIDMYPKLMECNSFYDLDSNLKLLNDIVSLKKDIPDKYILLTGNHTDSYIWPNFTSARRTDHKNWKEYNNFFKENLEYFNLVWTENDVIFSHAGITKDWAYDFLADYMQYDESALQGISFIKECTEVLKDTPLKDFNKHYIEAISNISYYRGGEFLCGSCEWADLKEHIDKIWDNGNIRPKGEDGIYQIFGHTQLKKPLITNKWACLDCRKGFIIDTLTHEITKCTVRY